MSKSDKLHVDLARMSRKKDETMDEWLARVAAMGKPTDTTPDRKHTPLPWKVLAGVSSNGMIAPDAATAIVADNEDGWDIAAVWTDLPGMNGAENPEFIALACNSHYKLVEALQAASDELQAMHGEYCQHQDYCPQETPKSEQCPTIAIIETARAALAAAAE